MIKSQPSFALTLKRLNLALEYDTAWNSCVVEWVETWTADHGIEVEMKPDGEKDSESDVEFGDEVSLMNGGLMIRY